MTTPATSLDPKVEALSLLAKVWCQLERNIGLGKLCFPRRLVWLNGAPGAGKGTNAPLLMHLLGITAQPLVTSDLLTSTQFKALIASGQLVDDATVAGLLVQKLLEPLYRDGAMIDGFPRTRVQAEFIRLLRDRLADLSRAMSGTPRSNDFPIPDIRFVVLQVTEAQAVERQLKRGRETQAHNEKVTTTGQGELRELRATDLDPAVAAKRYRVFCEQTVVGLEAMRNEVPYHLIDATGDIPAVRAAIEHEFTGLKRA